MHNLRLRFTQIFRIHRPSIALFLIVGAAISFFYRCELQAELNSTQADQKTFPMPKEWGTISALPTGLKLEISKSVSSHKIQIPRMNNRVKAIYFAQDAGKKPLTLKPGITEWEIQLPQTDLTLPASVIVEFNEAPYLPIEPAVIQENAAMQLVLDAKDAIVHGELLRFEPQPHKNTVGYWANEQDWCEWKLDLKSSGVFDVYLLQGCGKGQGGSEVQLSVGEQKLNFVVEDTGHFQNFKERHIGKVQLNQSGVLTLQVKPIQKARNAVMDVRQIRLVRQ
tara:strand:- start:4000 stop:4839 length:840 start_codon:yes stop_codon:yes gene_type:complete